MTASSGRFLGYGASTAIIYYLDTASNNIKRTHHARIDDVSIENDASIPSATLIRQHLDFHKVHLPPSLSTLHTVKSPFEYHLLFTYTVIIPPSGPLGLVLENDKVFGCTRNIKYVHLVYILLNVFYIYYLFSNYDISTITLLLHKL